VDTLRKRWLLAAVSIAIAMWALLALAGYGLWTLVH